MNQVLLAFIAGLLAFWTVVLALGRGKRGKLEIYPGILIIRSGLSLEPIRDRGTRRVVLVFAYVSFVALVVSLGLFYFYVFRLFYIKYFLSQKSVQGFSPLIPGVTLSLEATLYIMFAIGVAAFFHEMAHALVARGLGLKIKDAGIALFLFIPAAFVEIDEEDLKKARLRDKTLVYSAGVGANVILGLIFTLLLAHAAAAYASGVQIINVTSGSPAANAGLQPGDIIVGVNGTSVKTVADLEKALMSIGAHNSNKSVVFELQVLRDGKTLNITVYKPKGDKMIGIYIKQYYPPGLPGVAVTILYSLQLINISLAMVNAAPLVLPLPGGAVYADGAQIIRDALAAKLGEEKAALAALVIGTITLALIISLMSLSRLPLP